MASFKCECYDDSDIDNSYANERRSCDSEKGILEDDNKIANRRRDRSCSIGSDVAQHGLYLYMHAFQTIPSVWAIPAVNSIMGYLGIIFSYRPYYI